MQFQGKIPCAQNLETPLQWGNNVLVYGGYVSSKLSTIFLVTVKRWNQMDLLLCNNNPAAAIWCAVITRPDPGSFIDLGTKSDGYVHRDIWLTAAVSENTGIALSRTDALYQYTCGENTDCCYKKLKTVFCYYWNIEIHLLSPTYAGISSKLRKESILSAH